MKYGGMRYLRPFRFGVVLSLAVAAIVLVACDDGSESVRVTDRYTLDMLDAGVSLTTERCDSARIGQMLYVGDSASIYYCSGKAWKKVNGRDGRDGRDGKDGEDGTDGKRGEYGTSGTECFIEKFTEGFVLGCGATKAVVRYNFEIPDTCNISLEEDSSYVLLCGSDSAKIGDGAQGDAGDVCRQVDIGGGQVRLVCGQDSVTLFKAACGEIPFDPDGSQFCYGDTLVERCDSRVYDIKKNFCYNEELVDLCAGKAYELKEQFCYNDSLVDLCAGKEYDLSEQFCYNDSLVDLCGGEEYDIKQQFCYDNALVNLCGGETYDPKMQFCHNDELFDFCAGLKYDPDKESCYEGVVVPKCPTELDDNQFCDERNGKVYRFTEIGGMTWMAQNLDYKVPNSFCQDSLRDNSLYCVGEQVAGKRYEPIGRYYPWSVAMARSEAECGRKSTCPGLTYPHQGVCPDGWHLPDTTEWAALIAVMGSNAVAYWDESVRLTYGTATNEFGFSAITTGIIQVEFKEDAFRRSRGAIVNPTTADIWSSTELSNYYAVLYYLYTSEFQGRVTINKYQFDKSGFARTVRCVKN